MNDKKTDIICHCSGTTRKQIKTLIDSGVDDAETLSWHTGACLGCGACETAVLEFLAECKTAV
ncbi:MAG: (2Fe-2S)-binding protein [Gammaproteobacteria bacterium]